MSGAVRRSLSHLVRSVRCVLKAMTDDLLSAFLPARCPGCGARGAVLCNQCARQLRPPPPVAPPGGIAWWTACFAYEGVARELIARAKYRNERVALHWLAERVAASCAATPMPIDTVTWAPASDARRRAHGVDHAAVLARAVAAAHGLPAKGLLRRARGSNPQTGRDAQSRRLGPLLSAQAVPDGATVLIVDDVATTGGTLAAAARALRAAGAREVIAATAARTPRPGARAVAAAYTRNAGTR
jgi:predicted amidophosphoribosyltransferase